VTNFQQADTGTKMIHLGTLNQRLFQRNFCGRSQNSYSGLVRISPNADNARNFSQCDSLLMGNNCGAHTPKVKKTNHKIEHEATTSKIGEDQVFIATKRNSNRKQLS
jgi:Fe-S cluster assembly protein SufB